MLEGGLFSPGVFSRWGEIGDKFGELFGGNAGGRQRGNFQGAGDCPKVNGDRIANTKVSAGFGGDFAHENLAEATCLHREGTSLENAYAPEPFIDA